MFSCLFPPFRDERLCDSVILQATWQMHDTKQNKTKQQGVLSLVTYPGVLASHSSRHPLPETAPNSRGG